MNQIPLLCPRCGRPQRIVHQEDPHHPVRVVHTETGREPCDEPAGEVVGEDDGEVVGEPPTDPERSGLNRC
ncbi:hypothetical protein [Kitasatospora cineracea]|uniref:Uncharacterized protein n=1 Tax=Kitasatospora cineracea TaxID=88074 RepID=A0A3N4RXM2_9ACTN|nr:hypothetical protein [Kitasatospora cineracea]ROR45142.1 hypothetical protein EDD39_3356 [Kitasatospora cineracea]RPE35495.1 hypothetical protein EDD38_3845 [Kitasatospora cineracea]